MRRTSDNLLPVPCISRDTGLSNPLSPFGNRSTCLTRAASHPVSPSGMGRPVFTRPVHHVASERPTPGKSTRVTLGRSMWGGSQASPSSSRWLAGCMSLLWIPMRCLFRTNDHQGGRRPVSCLSRTTSPGLDLSEVVLRCFMTGQSVHRYPWVSHIPNSLEQGPQDRQRMVGVTNTVLCFPQGI